LKELDSIYHAQKQAKLKNPVEMRAVLEQAAKESGGQYTNRHELTGKDGGPMQTENTTPDLSKLSTEELLKLREINSKLNGS
jgi:hypothetical protein